MNSPASVLTFLLLTLALPLAQAERVFTSSDGKELSATLVRANEKSATLLRARDQREFTIPLSRLSEADQAYIRKWIARQAPAPHPLGWRRLRIRNQGPEVIAGSAPIFGSGFGSVDATSEYYLPTGAWMQVSDSQFGDGLVSFDGKNDWTITTKGGETLIQTTPNSEPRPLSVRVDPGDVDPVPTKELKALIAAGVSVKVASPNLETLQNLDAAPAAMILQALGGDIPWKEIPGSVRALQIRGGGADLDLDGIEALSRLQHLNIVVTRQKVTGLAALARLPKLTALSISSYLDPKELPDLGKLPALRHLSLYEKTEAKLPRESFDFLGKLRALETLDLGGSWIHDKVINASVLKNCPRLSRFDFKEESYDDEGAFLEALPKLTYLTATRGAIPLKRMTDLMDRGHFQHVLEFEGPTSFPIRKMPELRKLHLFWDNRPDSFKELGPLPKLESLSLSGASDEALKRLADAPALQGLRTLALAHLRDCNSFAPLTALPELASLTISYPGRGGPAQVDLSTFATLNSFSAYQYQGLKALPKLGKIKSLDLTFCPVVTLGDGEPNPHLERLRIIQADELENLDGLADCSKLRILHLSGCLKLKSASGLPDLPSLQHCTINSCGAVPDQPER